MAPEREVLQEIENAIGLYPDFPKKGILFRDIMPIFNEPKLLESMIEVLARRATSYSFDRILGVESRGFLIGPLLAQKLKVPFNPIRKRGKLPGELYSVDYDLEYGSDTLQVQKSCLPPNSKCLIVDDLIATGGSLEASKKLVELSGSHVSAYLVIIELKALEGKTKLSGSPLVSLFSY